MLYLVWVGFGFHGKEWGKKIKNNVKKTQSAKKSRKMTRQ